MLKSNCISARLLIGYVFAEYLAFVDADVLWGFEKCWIIFQIFGRNNVGGQSGFECFPRSGYRWIHCSYRVIFFYIRANFAIGLVDVAAGSVGAMNLFLLLFITFI